MSIDRLILARNLELPTREAMLQRDSSVRQFWNQNRALLSDAWKEWEMVEKDRLPSLDDSLFDANLRNAVVTTWMNPDKEETVRDLWQEVSPGVFKCQFFDPGHLVNIRNYLINASNAKIPLRPPYGIVLNRGGAMLDRRSDGYLAAPHFQAWYQLIIDKYMRPIARLLFPEVTGYDTQTFGFSIQYQANQDKSLRLHTDASAVTLNINLNLPGESFSGSELNFYDPTSGQMNEMLFTPGTAVIHRGNVAHAAKPILKGERSNLVLWLYGKDGQIPYTEIKNQAYDPYKRWEIPSQKYDDFAPF